MTRRMWATLLVAGVLGAGAGCGSRESTLRALLLWPGEASCAACRAGAVDLMRHSGGPVTLVRESPYTIEAQFDLGDEPDRCIYYMFRSASWRIHPGPPLPSREFQCTPIGASVTSAGSTVGAPGEGGQMRVSVAEYDQVRRQKVVQHFDREFEVAWVPR
jgi:hypothetical protein